MRGTKLASEVILSSRGWMMHAAQIIADLEDVAMVSMSCLAFDVLLA